MFILSHVVPLIILHSSELHAGTALLLKIIFSKSYPGGNKKSDEPDDALYARSEPGWIYSDLFLTWIKIYLEHRGSQRPIIDGHASHITLDVIDLV